MLIVNRLLSILLKQSPFRLDLGLDIPLLPKLRLALHPAMALAFLLRPFAGTHPLLSLVPPEAQLSSLRSGHSPFAPFCGEWDSQAVASFSASLAT